jgi:hypothetical protein
VIATLGPLLQAAGWAPALLMHAAEIAFFLLAVAESAGAIWIGLETCGTHAAPVVLITGTSGHRHALGDPPTAVYPQPAYVASYVARQARRQGPVAA